MSGLIAAVGSWWSSGDYSTPWGLVAFVAVPSALAALWVGRHDGKAGLAITAVVATSVCLSAAFWAWTPVPPIFAAVRAHQAVVTASAEAVLASHARGTCSSATSIDLGPLADHGPWSKVCVYGTADGSIRGLQFIRPADSTAPGLLYSATGDSPMGTPTMSSGCVRRVTGNWWADRSPDRSDPNQPCPRQYTYMPNN